MSLVAKRARTDTHRLTYQVFSSFSFCLSPTGNFQFTNTEIQDTAAARANHEWAIFMILFLGVACAIHDLVTSDCSVMQLYLTSLLASPSRLIGLVCTLSPTDTLALAFLFLIFISISTSDSFRTQSSRNSCEGQRLSATVHQSVPLRS